MDIIAAQLSALETCPTLAWARDPCQLGGEVGAVSQVLLAVCWKVQPLPGVCPVFGALNPWRQQWIVGGGVWPLIM